MLGTAFRAIGLSAAIVALIGPATGCSSCGGGSGNNNQICTSNDDCPEGSFCDTINTEQCHPLECSDHADCPIQWLCSDEGECYDPYNGSFVDCFFLHEGCACAPADLGLTLDCTPPEVPDGVDKSCHSGKSECDGERYGPCEDTYQDDCDGIHFGAGDFHPTEENSDNVKTGVEGELQLDPDERHVDFGYLWVANTGESTVSKIDVETGREVARYVAALPEPGLPQDVIPYPGGGPWNDCLHCPSRTAIDFNGDAFVANRAFLLQGSVTKFANAEENCVDADGNGTIDTSFDANDDGVIDVNDPAEFLGAFDECVLWSVPVGGINGTPRAIAIDAGSVPDWGANGNVWVGLFEESSAVMLNGDTGALIDTVPLVGGSTTFQPYGVAVDAWGFAWFADINSGMLAQVDTIGVGLVQIHDKVTTGGCTMSYGIAIDVKGRIWTGGHQCNTAARFDPSDNSWADVDLTSAGRGPHTRGIAPDLAGTVWVAHTSGWVTRIDAETLQEIEAYQIPHHLGSPEAVTDTIGVGIDRNNACWAVSINQGQLAGTATRIQPGGAMDSFPVGYLPYTYSDFTGFGLQTVVRPSGWYNIFVAGCEDRDPAPPDIKSDWLRLTWNELEPVGTNVRMRFRVADTVADLQTATWYGPFNDPDVDLEALGVPNANFMMLQVLLSTTDETLTPSFVGFDLSFDCSGGIVPD